MSVNAYNNHWKYYVTVSFIFNIVVLAIAIYRQFWILTAIPIGFLFGFFLQKGKLCGSSAFSEVLLMKNWEKIWGLWVCIVTSMIGFAILDVLGWITLNPKPFIWANIIIGGLIFGIGMVLAGGCVSGCLFKAGYGNLNSIIAILGIALGISAVLHGPLRTFNSALKAHAIKMADGSQLTINSLTGLPFWAITLIIAGITLALAFSFKRNSLASNTAFSLKDTILSKSWKPWQAGLLIGLLSSFAYLSSSHSGRNYPLGTTHGVLGVQLLLTDHNLKHVYKKDSIVKKTELKPVGELKAKQVSQKTSTSQSPGKKTVKWWITILITSLILGSWISGKLSGETQLLSKPPQQVLTALFGGIFVGAGATIGGGCVVGNIISGWALLSVGAVLFTLVVIVANWITTYFYLMGGTIDDFSYFVFRSPQEERSLSNRYQ